MSQTGAGQDSFRATSPADADSVGTNRGSPENPANPLCLPPLILPFGGKSLAEEWAATEAVEVPIDSGVLPRLSRISPDLNSVLLALWQTLLWRFSDQAEVVVGCLSRARQRTVPIAVSFSPGLSFADVVHEVEKAELRAQQPDNQLQLGNDMRSPAGFLTERVSRDANRPSSYPHHFQVLLHVQSDVGSWHVELLFDPACFTRPTAERMARSYATMLSGAASDPNVLADSLPMLSDKDYEEVVISFNQSRVLYPDQCVHHLFEDQVRRTPGHTALRFRNQTFTYERLNARANQLAHLLRRRGVSPNVPAALFVERSAEMIIGLLAILKAGGCYVPLVHDDPPARLSYLLADTQPPVVVTSEQLLPRLPAYSGEVVLFDNPMHEELESDPENTTNPGDLACIIYTSGSTGVPKGVAARHSNLANYIQFICERLGHPQGWHFATVSTISAILGNTSIFGALLSGGCLHVIDYETALSPHLFADYVARHPIDAMKIAPSQLSALLRGVEGRPILPGKYVVLGGEKFTWELLQEIRNNGTCKVMNHYGPTETMGCSTFAVDDDDYDFGEARPATVPLGRPMSNQQLYILDSHLRPVPVGVPGELCMSGAGLTVGYFNQPQQTAEKFVANPFSPEAGGRLYRTGDRARFLPDGNIEFLGRIDHQAKIRGFRVEPEEVEAMLKLRPDIRQAVVVPEEGPAGEKLLAAYIVPSNALAVEELPSFLRQRLPEYMVPSRVLMLESLPLNRNGKLDLPALAALRAEDHQGKKAREMVAPRNPTEEQLADIWREVLERERIGVHDNFFELGGHSLLAIQVISRMRNNFRLEFSIVDFFLSPTIAELAEKISQYPRAESEEMETERLLRELENMSDEEAESLLPKELGSDEASGGTPE